MTTMEWKEVEPEQKDWERQIDVVAYYGSYTIGSIAYCGAEFGWIFTIGKRQDSLLAENEEEAKKEFVCILDEHFQGEINYYSELKESLSDLN